MTQTQKRRLPYFFLIALLLMLFLPFIGSQPLNLSKVFGDASSLDAEIFWQIRLPRVFFAFWVGAGLALIGAVFQALLRNDLATPYTLGVSSGGALGAVLALKLNLLFSWFIFSTVSLFSIAGSLLAIGIIYFIAARGRMISVYTLILAGVAISFFFSALNLFIHYMADFTETYRMIRWMMGALDVAGWSYPIVLALLVLPLFAWFLMHYKAFNILLAGDEMALSKGVEGRRIQKVGFIGGSVLVGFIVALSGPIGFVGLVVPHVMRLLFGPDHKVLFTACLVGGGVFLALCDSAARTVIAPAELPVGIITALLGGPFFVYLLVRRKDHSALQ